MGVGEVTSQRKTSTVRRAEIHEAMLAVAEASDYRYMTREAVAAHVGVAAPLINAYVGGVEEMREHTVALAIRLGRLRVIAQAMAARHPAVQRLDFQTKLRAAREYLHLPTVGEWEV